VLILTRFNAVPVKDRCPGWAAQTGSENGERNAGPFVNVEVTWSWEKVP
jgi:hypothetical protein